MQGGDTGRPGFKTLNLHRLQGCRSVCEPDLWPPWGEEGISLSRSTLDTTTSGFIWVLSALWWFSSYPPQTREPGQGYEGQVVGVVKVWGQTEVQPTTDSNEATHATPVSGQCQTQCLILVYIWDHRNFLHSSSSFSFSSSSVSFILGSGEY